MAGVKACAAAGTVLIAAAGCAAPPRPALPSKAGAKTPAPRRAAPSAAAASVPPAGKPAIYAYTRPGAISPRWRGDPERVYVPDSLGDTVTVINPRTYKVIGRFQAGGQPNHLTPSWNGSVLWMNNTGGSSLTRIDPKTGKPGRSVPVADPYNLYFTPNGRYALVMAEALHRIDFRDPRTMRLLHSMHVPCAGVNHLDFSADRRYALASGEFSAQVLRIDLARRKVVGSLRLGVPTDLMRIPGGAMPQDVRLSPDGTTFYVADMIANGVWLIGASRFRKIGFIHTGLGAHGLPISSGARYLFVSNRNAGSISVISTAERKVVHAWRIPRRRVSRHGRHHHRWEGHVVGRQVQRRGVCHIHRHRPPDRQDRRRR